MDKIVEKYAELPGLMRKPLWRLWHRMITSFDKERSTVFMNYGYTGENGEFEKLKLKEKDQPNKYSIQLYDHVARNFKFAGKHVLEVGSGRGGGAAFLAEYYKPKSYTGLDISKKTLKFCNSKHRAVKGLRFVKGHAEALPFKDNCFDALVNVESARVYGNIPKFFTEVYRVLKPGGKFLFADMIKPGDIEKINKGLEDAGLSLVEKINIRKNVVKALQLDTEYRKEHIHKKAPKFLHKSFYQFAGVEGSERYDAFDKNRIDYWSYTLEKNGKA
ncbi:MAG: methyltransferase domain-containing protein [Bacteroidota bacterium]|nr:methyltransferase domain-containing protein [Bacteroidota bacterium]